MRFSQRIGRTPVRDSIQIESIDIPLENRLWNTILDDFFEKISNSTSPGSNSARGEVCLYIWTEFFFKRSDEIPTYSRTVYTSQVIEIIKDWFFQAEWYEKYDFLEFLSKLDSHSIYIGFTDRCNLALKKESAGYRIVDNMVVQITSEEEIVAIENALTNSTKWQSVNTHLNRALEFLSDRQNPDYRNSIKESISSVESLCIILTGEKDATLGKALAIIDKKFRLHGALKNAFSSLYGYTSDAGGIRHSLLEDDIAVTLEDAKFMLVSCSAFINYLKAKIEL